jgi:hypothetical protein
MEPDLPSTNSSDKDISIVLE